MTSLEAIDREVAAITGVDPCLRDGGDAHLFVSDDGMSSLELDSLTLFEILCAIEETCDIEIDDTLLHEDVITLRQLLSVVGLDLASLSAHR